MLKCGADVNIRNDYGDSALYFAIETNNIGIVKLLLQNGAGVTNAEIEQAKVTNLGIAKLLIKDDSNTNK